MSVAAIAIDNFLDTSKWNTIQAGISEYLNAPLYSENRTSLHTDINSWINLMNPYHILPMFLMILSGTVMVTTLFVVMMSAMMET